MKELRLFAYNIGHGLCTLLHGINDDGSPYNAVFDCGYQPACAGKEYNIFPIDEKWIDKVLNHMAGLILEGGNDHLDLLVSSHQDQDHNNLIIKLLSKLNRWSEPVNQAHWFLRGENTMINGYTRDTKKITLCKNGNIEYVYKDSSDFRDYIYCSKEIEITQTVSSLTGDLYCNKLIAVAKNNVWGYKDKSNEKNGTPKFEIKIQANISQEKNRKTIVVQYTEIETTLTFNQNEFNMKWSSEEIFISYNNWYDCIIADFNHAIFIKSKGSQFEKVIQIYTSWLTWLGNYYFKAENIMYDCNSLNYLIGQRAQLKSPTFKLNTVIMGGYSESDRYIVLKNFLEKYVKQMFRGNFQAFSDFKFLNLDICNPSIPLSDDSEDNVTKLNIINKYIDDEKGVIYNATAVVVNLIYKDKANNSKSILFPGDVTHHNQLDVASELENSGVKCQYIFAPHHGSYNSNFILNKNGEISKKFKQPLEKLYNAMGNEVSTVFSECVNNTQYHIPSKAYFDIAEQHAPFDPRKHNINMFDRDRKLITIEVDKGIYLTGDAFFYASRELIECVSKEPMTVIEKRDNIKPNTMKRSLPPNSLFV